MTQATIDVLKERRAQAEAYSLDHDDAHKRGEIAMAAVAYALGCAALYPFNNPEALRCGRRLALVRAAALLIAEIERLDRIPVPVPVPVLGAAVV